MLEMLIQCFTIDEYIIKEDQQEVPQAGSEYCIHQCLECGRINSDAKGHNQKLTVAIMCVEIHFEDIILVNANLVIPRMKIQLGEQ